MATLVSLLKAEGKLGSRGFSTKVLEVGNKYKIKKARICDL